VFEIKLCVVGPLSFLTKLLVFVNFFSQTAVQVISERVDQQNADCGWGYYSYKSVLLVNEDFLEQM